MARFEMLEAGFGAMGATAQADILFELGMMYATGRDCDADVAWLMSAGPGDASRIYHTTDGGATWELQFQATNPAAFYDCFAFWTPTRGFAQSDSVNGQFPVVRTTNGQTWESIASNEPAALPGEFFFASSGTCVATEGKSNAWAVTGGASPSRVLVTRDGAIATVTLNNPGKRNALTVAMWQALSSASTDVTPAVGLLLIASVGALIIDGPAEDPYPYPYDEELIVQLQELLERELAQVRRLGYARDNEELEMGVRCIAAGVYDDTGKLLAGLSLSAPAERLHDDWIPVLLSTAAKISETLGYDKQR